MALTGRLGALLGAAGGPQGPLGVATAFGGLLRPLPAPPSRSESLGGGSGWDALPVDCATQDSHIFDRYPHAVSKDDAIPRAQADHTEFVLSRLVVIRPQRLEPHQHIHEWVIQCHEQPAPHDGTDGAIELLAHLVLHT